MAQNITLLGASYSDVPSVELPKTGGGTAQFDDTTIASNAASASDITSGKLAFVNGELVTGTASGGGGGLEYETGTWTPTSDIARYDIPFARTHTTAPCFYMVVYVSETYSSTSNTNYITYYANWLYALGSPVHDSSSTVRNGSAAYTYRGTSSTLSTNNASVTTNPDTTWSKTGSIRAYCGSTTRYWRAGCTYKWIAVWAPTS